jgi:hypothetical protein
MEMGKTMEKASPSWATVRHRRAYSAFTSRVPQDHMAWLNTFIYYRWRWLKMLSVLVDGDYLKCHSICINCINQSLQVPDQSIIAQIHSSQRKAQGISIQLQQDSIALGGFMHQHTGRKIHATCLSCNMGQLCSCWQEKSMHGILCSNCLCIGAIFKEHLVEMYQENNIGVTIVTITIHYKKEMSII